MGRTLQGGALPFGHDNWDNPHSHTAISTSSGGISVIYAKVKEKTYIRYHKASFFRVKNTRPNAMAQAAIRAIKNTFHA